jgi:DNA invertase Pin-like site-specific DNA recombinase
MVRDRQVSGVVVYRLDRLARDLVLQESLLADIRRMGGELFTTSAAEASYLTDDPDDPSRKLIRQVLGAVNEYERSMIRLRMRSGRAHKRATGAYAGDGSPPYGYRAEGGDLVPVPEEQAVIARIREMRAAGASLRQIGTTLTAEGLQPRPSKLRRTNAWAPESVRRIVHRLETSD